jgi:hypothetical protein|nr:hypothetical protein [Actinophrys sol]
MSIFDKLSIVEKKKIKLKDIFITESPDKNIYRSYFLFNFQKFRKRKWKFLRSKRYFSSSFIFKRFCPNLTYMPNYSEFITDSNIHKKDIKIKNDAHMLSYRSKLFLKKRILGFFAVRKFSRIKNLLIFRHMTTHFNTFDSNYETVLLRLGICNTIIQAREFVKCGVLKINNHIISQNRHLNSLDIVELSQNLIFFFKYDSVFNKVKKAYDYYKMEICSTVFGYMSLLLKEDPHRMFFDVLPFISTINFSTFDFIYFNDLMKNQWHFYLDFFAAKKFFHYNR